jgi:Rps23 Pro-64 3,4-dihydroxylase Tpa1-like proline 4-hydroxylase|tara:strand:- start:1717 stop:2568 length:852 start_codon:yes stop_codon:yes gene_type:complete
MNINKILSKDNQNLGLTAAKEYKNYHNGLPFPNIVIENFFNEDYLNQILLDFPDLSKIKSSQKYLNKNEIKYANNDYQNFPDSIKNFFEFLNSNMYLNFLQKLTSVKEKLIVDPQLNGGGLHEIKKGGVLKIHTDFNKHPSLKLDRRINVLIYLNKDWKDQYGGHLELWDKDMLGCKKKILPTFNKMVIFSTNDFSNHGHPDPVICPLNQSRKSIALYYFSEGRPLEDLDKNHIKNRTYFKNRVGFENDTDNQNDSLKNLIRNLKLFKLMKKLEKKYLRKKKD